MVVYSSFCWHYLCHLFVLHRSLLFGKWLRRIWSLLVLNCPVRSLLDTLDLVFSAIMMYLSTMDPLHHTAPDLLWWVGFFMLLIFRCHVSHAPTYIRTYKVGDNTRHQPLARLQPINPLTLGNGHSQSTSRSSCTVVRHWLIVSTLMSSELTSCW